MDSVASGGPVYATSPRPVTLRPLASLPCYTPYIVIELIKAKPASTKVELPPKYYPASSCNTSPGSAAVMAVFKVPLPGETFVVLVSAGEGNTQSTSITVKNTRVGLVLTGLTPPGTYRLCQYFSMWWT